MLVTGLFLIAPKLKGYFSVLFTIYGLGRSLVPAWIKLLIIKIQVGTIIVMCSFLLHNSTDSLSC